MANQRSASASLADILENMHWTVKYVFPFIVGAFAGLLFFMPINEYVIFSLYEKGYYFNFLDYMGTLYVQILKGDKVVRMVYYSILGGTMGVIISSLFVTFQKRRALLYMLNEEMQRNIHHFISQGENDFNEFKSSFRYDYRQEKVNRGLEQVIMKTLAGFMNSDGGTLLIGINDDGEVLGLEKDYETLKRKDADGYEQLLISTIANVLGTPACKLVKLNFHRVNEKEVCRVTVAKSQKPVYVKNDKTSKFYVRTGSGTREMEVDEAVEFIGTRYGA